ncbi:MAG: DegT/DnrJ/EryC1/StrS family aminotransferase [Patescibacteria group bacterium]
MNIPFVDLGAQYNRIKPEIDAAIERVVRNSRFVLGEEVERFEADFARYCGAQYAVGVQSGTSALFLALAARGIGPGDEVITQSNSFIATAAAISHTGATPVFVDVDPATGLMDPALIQAAITTRTKAIIPVHLYGQIAPMYDILAVAKRHHLWILEDACQAHGALQNGKRAGSFGDAAAFSFYPGKNLGAYGEGGAVVTSDEALASRIRRLRDHGSPEKYVHAEIGYNMRLEGLAGAVLGVKLAYLDEWNTGRRNNANRYHEMLSGIAGLALPAAVEGNEHVWHLFTILTEQRDELQKFLKERGIATGIHYPIPIHLQKAYVGLGHAHGSFPATERMARETLSLPMYPELTQEQIRYVATAIKEFFHAL